MKCIKCGRNIRTSPDERSAFKNMGYYTPMYWVRDQGMDEKTCIDAGLDPNDSSHFLCFDCYYDLMDIQRAEYMKDYEGKGNVIKLSNKFKESEDTVYRKGGRVEDLIQIVDELQIGEEVYINAINISPAAIAMLKDMVSGGILEPKTIELERVVVPEALGDFYNGQSICPQMTYIKKRNIKSSPIREYKEMKECPYCGEYIDSYEPICPICDSVLDETALDESVKLQEGKKLKAAILAGLMAFTGLAKLNANSLKTTKDWNKDYSQIKKEFVAEYGENGDIPEKDLNKMWLACCRWIKSNGSNWGVTDGKDWPVERWDRSAQNALAEALDEIGFEDAADEIRDTDSWDKLMASQDKGYSCFDLGQDDPKDLDEDTEVSFDFSNNEDAKDFIDDTKEKYHYKTGTRKYEVDKGGTTPRGGKVYFKGAVRRS